MTNLLNPNNRLFTLARQARCQPSWLEPIAVVFVILSIVVIPGQMLARLVVRWIVPPDSESIATPIVQIAIGFLPIYLALWAWLRFSSKRPFQSLGFENKGALEKALRGALVAGLMMAATAGLAIIPGAAVKAGMQTSGVAALGIGFLTLLAYLVQGPAEEVLFRGWLLPVIGARYRPLIGVLVSALFFGLAHALNSTAPLALANLFLFGVFAALYALAEGGLWGIGAWHAVWNWAQGDLLGFAVSGSTHSGLFVSIRATGPAIVTGGPFGLEGGMAATAVFLIAIGAIILLDRRNARRSPS